MIFSTCIPDSVAPSVWKPPVSSHWAYDTGQIQLVASKDALLPGSFPWPFFQFLLHFFQRPLSSPRLGQVPWSEPLVILIITSSLDLSIPPGGEPQAGGNPVAFLSLQRGVTSIERLPGQVLTQACQNHTPCLRGLGFCYCSHFMETSSKNGGLATSRNCPKPRSLVNDICMQMIPELELLTSKPVVFRMGSLDQPQQHPLGLVKMQIGAPPHTHQKLWAGAPGVVS